jgi:hypothetical protein
LGSAPLGRLANHLGVVKPGGRHANRAAELAIGTLTQPEWARADVRGHTSVRERESKWPDFLGLSELNH